MYMHIHAYCVDRDVNVDILRALSGCICLHVCHFVARKSCRITSGQFTSVVVHQGQVYTADREKCQTQVFQRSDTSSSSAEWRQLRSIDHDFDNKSWLLTLIISNNQLKCCSQNDYAIKVYSLSGELLQTHGRRGTEHAGGLSYPYISDDDDDGSVLIADQRNHRLQVMSEQGEFSVLQLKPVVSGPRSAVLFNNQLYVSRPGELCRYSC